MTSSKAKKMVLFKKNAFLLLAISFLILFLVQPASNAQNKADESLITLPAKKNETKPKASSSTQKKDTAPQTPKTETMLQGVVYDLKLMKDRQRNQSISFPVLSTADGKYREEYRDTTVNILKDFVNGPWQKSVDAAGRVSFPALNRYYCSSTRVWASSFCMKEMESSVMPQAFACAEDVSPLSIVCIYSGYVVAPFTGQFRFIGGGDDFLVVRFREKIVLDYGYCSATLGVSLDAERRSILSPKKSNQQNAATTIKKNPIERFMPSPSTLAAKTEEKPLYSRISLELYSNACMNGVAYGEPVSVKKGEVIPIEILMADMGNTFSFLLFYEHLDANGKPATMKRPLLLFRTSEEFPSSFSSDTAFTYDKNSPVWRVVNAKGRSIPSHIKENDSAKKSKDTAADKKSAGSKTVSTASETAKKDTASGKDSASGRDSATDKASSAVSSETKQPSESKPATKTENSSSGEKKGNTSSGKVTNPFGVTSPWDDED